MKFTCFHLMPYRPLDLKAASDYRSAWVVLPNSFYDPKKGAEVLFGPAPRPLPSLGLKVADGVVTVAAGFSSRVGGTVK